MRTKHEIINTCRQWLGTPYLHQQSLKGVGCDCLGFVKGVAQELGCLPSNFDDIEPLAKGYGREPYGMMVPLFKRWCDEVAKPEVGDILIFRIRRKPQHCGFYLGETMIHARHRVVEHRIDSGWSNRITNVFRLKLWLP